MTRQFDYRMLIVDDDAVFCEIADELFSSVGYTVRCADDGFEALAMMKQALPDIIICDLNLPKMSGFELLSIIRRRFPQIPVIAMSGEYAGNDLPSGVIADAYLQKGGDTPPRSWSQRSGSCWRIRPCVPAPSNLLKPRCGYLLTANSILF